MEEAARVEEQKSQNQQPQKPVLVRYSSIAKNTDKNKTGFSIKLLDCEDNQDN